DETELPAIYAGVSEDYEEETLENAADLGTMIREMSIDQITRPELPELDEDDDFDISEEEMEEDELAADGPIAASDIDEVEEEQAAEEEEYGDSEATEAAEAEGEGETTTEREPGRRYRRDTRRRGRDRGGERRGGHSRNGGRSGRHSMQTTDLPAISDLLKPGQEVLIQIAKEPIAKKGARITSHIALPGRFLVFMPTVNHVGVSRKIDSDGER